MRVNNRSMFNNSPSTAHKPPPCGSSAHAQITRSIDLSVSVLVIILNIVEIVLILKLKRKKRIYEILLLSLSCSDLLFGTANTAVSVIFLSNSCRFEDIVEFIYSFYLFVIIVSILHLSWIALDRLWAVSRPFKHNIFVTRKKLYVLITCTWFVAVTVATLLHVFEELSETSDVNSTVAPVLTSRRPRHTGIANVTRINISRQPREIIPKAPSKPGKKERYIELVQLAISCVLVVADVLFVICYGYMTHILNSKAKYSKVQAKKEDRISLLCIIIAGLFVLLTLPYALDRLISNNVHFAANILLIINSGMNSIVYFFRSKCEKYVEKKYNQKHIESPHNSHTKFSLGLTPASTPVITTK